MKYKMAFQYNKEYKIEDDLIKGMIYDIEGYKYLPVDTHIRIYVELAMPNLSDQEKDDIQKHRKYIRFMCVYDTTRSRCFMYTLCEPIHQIDPEYIGKAITMMKKDKDMVLGEINYKSKGYFFSFDF